MEIEHCHDATNYIEKAHFFFYAKCDAIQNFWGEHCYFLPYFHFGQITTFTFNNNFFPHVLLIKLFQYTCN